MNTDRDTVFAMVAIVLVTCAILIINQGFKDDIQPDESKITGNYYNDTYMNKPARIPDKVNFAGERMPLENFDTRESLDRELIISSFRHSSTILIIKRANRYLPVIEKILKEYNVPDDFKYLVAAESEFSNMVSPAKATGFWQIMYGTGKDAGMEINNVVDERYCYEKSTRLACKYILDSYARYNSWTLAAASYNSGRASIDEQIEIQKENSYYDLLLNEETARYIFRVVAYKLIITDPARYGFIINKDELYPQPEYYEVRVDTAINNFSDFAKRFGTNYKILKFLNPWLRKPYLPERSGKTYVIKIPAEGMRTYSDDEVM